MLGTVSTTLREPSRASYLSYRGSYAGFQCYCSTMKKMPNSQETGGRNKTADDPSPHGGQPTTTAGDTSGADAEQQHENAGTSATTTTTTDHEQEGAGTQPSRSPPASASSEAGTSTTTSTTTTTTWTQKVLETAPPKHNGTTGTKQEEEEQDEADKAAVTHKNGTNNEAAGTSSAGRATNGQPTLQSDQQQTGPAPKITSVNNRTPAESPCSSNRTDNGGGVVTIRTETTNGTAADHDNGPHGLHRNRCRSAEGGNANGQKPPHRKCCMCWCCCCSCSCLSVGKTNNSARRTENNNKSTQQQLTSLDHFFNEENGAQPTLEEIRMWGESFDRLMKCPAGRKLFRDFLKCEYSEENILFWLACEDLKKEANPDIIEEKARLIYEDYISILSPKEVSLDSRVREIINKNMVEPTPHTFDEAQLQIYTLMHRDSYPRFVNSSMYRKLAQLPSPSRKNSSA